MIKKIKEFLKAHYPKPEYSIALLFAITITLLLMPFSIENTRQANLISKWNMKINRIEYMFSVMTTQATDDMLKSLKNAQTTKDKEQILLMIVKPYLRVNTVKKPSRHYKPKFLNGSVIPKDNMFYFEDFYFGENNNIVGIKNIHTETLKDPLFIMMFDLNGILLPNKWGKDIFGVYVYDEGVIKPFGYEKALIDLKNDCSVKGTGIGCSYYYTIGGDFDE